MLQNYVLSGDFMRFKAFLAVSRIKQLKFGLFDTNLGTQHYLVYIIVLKWLDLKIIVICLKLRVKLQFYAVLRFFGNFAHKVAQTLSVLHETWQKTLFGIYIIVLNWLDFKCFGTLAHKVAQTWFCFARNLAQNTICNILLC